MSEERKKTPVALWVFVGIGLLGLIAAAVVVGALMFMSAPGSAPFIYEVK